jgi:tRNA 2-thiouridine synthesizing protein A
VGVRHTESSLIVWTKARQSVAGMPAAQPNHDEGLKPIFGAERYYDAGDKGCASGPMDEIAALVRSMGPGETLEIRATDPSVAFDLAAWCRMTGHSLVRQQDDHYLVQKS